MSGLSYGFRQVQTQDQIEVVGGCTLSIFPKVETFLLADSDHQNALNYVAATKKMDVYRSMIDFLFCEIYTEYRRPCQRFYVKKGPCLADMATRGQIDEWEKILLHALLMALKIHQKKRSINWTKFRFEVMYLTI